MRDEVVPMFCRRAKLPEGDDSSRSEHSSLWRLLPFGILWPRRGAWCGPEPACALVKSITVVSSNSSDRARSSKPIRVVSTFPQSTSRVCSCLLHSLVHLITHSHFNFDSIRVLCRRCSLNHPLNLDGQTKLSKRKIQFPYLALNLPFSDHMLIKCVVKTGEHCSPSIVL